MNKEKQIEEMVKDACKLNIACEDCNAHGVCKAQKYAERFYNAGYRKASEVAREIFEEIENLMNEVYSSVQYGCYSFGMTKHIDTPDAMRQMGKLEGVKHLGNAIAELKKKYTEEGK
jgi:hypothetical protein